MKIPLQLASSIVFLSLALSPIPHEMKFSVVLMSVAMAVACFVFMDPEETVSNKELIREITVVTFITLPSLLFLLFTGCNSSKESMAICLGIWSICVFFYLIHVSIVMYRINKNLTN